MKKLLVAIIGAIIAVGALSASLTMGSDNLSKMSVNPIQSSAKMLGHVTLTAYDENGNIKAYRQTDNFITNQFDDCLIEFAFPVTSGGGCTGQAGTVNLFDTMAIGAAASPSTSESQTALGLYITSGGSATGFDSAVATTAGGSGAGSVLITSTFRPGIVVSVTEAALQDTTSTTGNAIEAAIQTFTAISLGASDTLTVQWTVNVDG